MRKHLSNATFNIIFTITSEYLKWEIISKFILQMFASVKEFQLKHWIFSFEDNATLRKRWHIHTMKYYFLSNKTQISNLGK